MSQRRTPTPVHIDPHRFNALVAVLRSIDEDRLTAIRRFEADLVPVLDNIEADAEKIALAANAVTVEERRFMQRNRPSDDAMGKDPSDLFGQLDRGSGFLPMVFSIVQGISQSYALLYGLVNTIHPGTIITTQDGFNPTTAKSYEQLQHMLLEFEVNEPVVTRFVNSMVTVETLPARIITLADNIHKVLENYYKTLLHRHSVEGIQVHGGSPVATDLAMTIYDNVDANGEIQDGKDPNEVSAYTIRKAEIIAKALKEGLVGGFIRDPRSFYVFISMHLRALHDTAHDLMTMFSKEVSAVREAIDPHGRRSKKDWKVEFAIALVQIDEVDPQSVVFRERTTLLSAEERFNLKFRNDTLANVVKLLVDATADDASVIQYILNRKAELRRYFQEENSFYVCRIGQGNPFSDEAPGGLTVVPGSRPRASLDEILGSGFDEVKRFFGSIESASKYNDLFIATSPSRSADKSNVLLIGPQGCGKTEILRAVASDKKSIGVFAQGSDFNTCWKGEAEKNPKRMFEAGLRLQKESRRHVHFLIDEIDAVLNSDKEYGSFNLTLEFQILMDGVVEYPHLSVWGATNSPERIPMPMLRRFAKVLIVGELDKGQRVQLLKQFISFLPTSGLTDEAWGEAADRLEGATGDVIRKIADSLWREKMSAFTHSNPIEAEKLVRWLNDHEKFDVRTFSGDQRGRLHAQLSQHVCITPTDLDETISMALDNIAIHNEIETARLTYDRARGFLSSLNRTRSQVQTNGSKRTVDASPVQLSPAVE